MKSFFIKHKKIILIISIPVLCIAVILSGFGIANAILFNKKCKLGEIIKEGTIVEYSWSPDDEFRIEDYPSITAKNGVVKMLALTDTHLEKADWYATDFLWNKYFSIKKAYKHIDQLIRATDPDLIIITGDFVSEPRADLATKDLIDFLDGYKTPWTVTFGNHDGEWRVDKAFLSNLIEDSKYSIYQPGPTNLQGLGNSLITFKDSQGDIFQALITMDTGDWQQIDDYKIDFKNMHLDKTNRRFATTDVGFTEDQADWYRWVIEGLKNHNNGENIETMIACHIPPLPLEYALNLVDAYEYNPLKSSYYAFAQEDRFTDSMPDNLKDPKTKQEYEEAYNYCEENYEFYKAVTELKSTTNFISGHSHTFGYSIKYKGITHTSIVKTTNIYVDKEWDQGKRGGTIFEFSETSANGSHVIKNSPLYQKEAATLAKKNK